jgi:ADP-ribosylglycohydrolase
MNELYRRGMYGLAIGDAVGLPYQFLGRDEFVCTDMDGHGTYDMPAGTWSDDTSMAVATAHSLALNGGKVDVDDIRRRFLMWLREENYIIDICYDVGGTTWRSLTTGRPGMEVNDNGNGSLMRILPLAFTDCDDEDIRKVSGITHGHWIACTGCVIYIGIARRLIKGEILADIVKTLDYDYPYHRLAKLAEIPRNEVKSTGYVVDTLEAALWSLLHTDNYRDAILTAVNLGYDTDSVAAVAGGLAGIMYGVDQEWYERLRGKEVIDQIWEVE